MVMKTIPNNSAKVSTSTLAYLDFDESVIRTHNRC